MKKLAGEAPASGPTIEREAECAARRINYPTTRARPRASAIDARRAEVARLTKTRTQREIAAELGVSQATIFGDLAALGIDQRRGRHPKYPPPPTDRRCATCGEPLVFRYPSDAVDHDGKRVGVYCSNECRIAGTRKHPKPDARLCARLGCENPVQPRASDIRRGRRVFYCSHECRKTGGYVRCPQCGVEHYRPGSQSDDVFCSQNCWGLYRWRENIALDKLVAVAISQGRFKGPARQRHFGRWNGHKGAAAGIEAGRAKGGRPPKATPEQQQLMLELDKQGLSTRMIAARVFEDARFKDRVARFLRR